jgi:hypothetical protein
VISAKAVNILLQLSAFYLYEQAFSYLTKNAGKKTQTVCRGRTVVCLSKIRPRIHHLWKKETSPGYALKVNLMLMLYMLSKFMGQYS